MPTEGAPAATAASAYSIWTSLPEGLQKQIQSDFGAGGVWKKSLI